MLPLHIAQGFGPPPQSGEALWLLGLFAASIGLPFFALSANGPLLQAWFARSSHPAAKDPVFSLCRQQCRQLSRADLLSDRDRAVHPARRADLGLDRRLLCPDRADRGLRRADAALSGAQPRSKEAEATGSIGGARLGRHRLVGFPRRGSVRPADRGHRAYRDRCRGGAAALGAAARALSRHLRDRVPDPSADSARARGQGAAALHSGAGRGLRARPDRIRSSPRSRCI